MFLARKFYSVANVSKELADDQKMSEQVESPSCDPYVKLSNALAMHHTAAWPNQIAVEWSSNPSTPGNIVIKNARPLLMLARPFLDQCFDQREVDAALNPNSGFTPRSAVLTPTFRRVSVVEVDAIDPEVRAAGIAIRNSSDTAFAIAAADRVAPTLATISWSRSSKLDMERIGPLDVRLSAISSRGRFSHTLKLDASHAETIATLFSIPEAIDPGDRLPITARCYPAMKGDANEYCEMPSWLSQRVGQILQDGLRLHVLLTAAAPDEVSKPVVLEKVVLVTPPSGECQLVARLHKSAAFCICCAHHRLVKAPPLERVEFVLSFCGRQYPNADNKRCAVHFMQEPSFCSELPTVCLHRMNAKVKCMHAKGDFGMASEVDLPECTEPAFRVLAAAAVSLRNHAKAGSEAHKIEHIRKAVDTVFDEFETCEQRNSQAWVQKDLQAVALLKRGDVELCLRAGQPSLSGKDLTPAQRTLRNTHAHLFHKRKKRSR